MTHAVYVRIRNDVSDIGIFRDGLDNLARELGIPVRALTQLQIALDEFVSNVINYSWEDGGQHEFLVRIHGATPTGRIWRFSTTAGSSIH